jgi:hypothetical protein
MFFPQIEIPYFTAIKTAVKTTVVPNTTEFGKVPVETITG